MKRIRALARDAGRRREASRSRFLRWARRQGERDLFWAMLGPTYRPGFHEWALRRARFLFEVEALPGKMRPLVVRMVRSLRLEERALLGRRFGPYGEDYLR